MGLVLYDRTLRHKTGTHEAAKKEFEPEAKVTPVGNPATPRAEPVGVSTPRAD